MYSETLDLMTELFNIIYEIKNEHFFGPLTALIPFIDTKHGLTSATQYNSFISFAAKLSPSSLFIWVFTTILNTHV